MSAASDRHAHTRPRSAQLHLFRSGPEAFAFDVEGGRILHLADAQHDAIDAALQYGDQARAELMALGLGAITAAPSMAEPPGTVPLKALSLAVAQKCNLGCTYCYAQQGGFGGAASLMSSDVARASIDRLLDGARPGDRVTVAFMGGEPLTNRKVVQTSTRYAAEEAARRGVGVGFTMTTNATLLRDDDINLFDAFGFTLTVSVDGLQATNDQLRPFVSGKGSFEQVATNVSRLLAVDQRRFQVLARATVTPKNLDLPEIMTGLLEMGFDAVTFSPMLHAPTGREEMQPADLDTLLEQMIQCGEIFRAQLRQGSVLPFSNVTSTLQRIHSYKREQYPCGAGGGYMGVSANGALYACHRFVNDDLGHMGSVTDGVDAQQQSIWLRDRHLAQQSPCTGCWARYLCAGSCHYEAIKRGRPACDYIRGWLHYCLALYAELARSQPGDLRGIVDRD